METSFTYMSVLYSTVLDCTFIVPGLVPGLLQSPPIILTYVLRIIEYNLVYLWHYSIFYLEHDSPCRESDRGTQQPLKDVRP